MVKTFQPGCQHHANTQTYEPCQAGKPDWADRFWLRSHGGRLRFARQDLGGYGFIGGSTRRTSSMARTYSGIMFNAKVIITLLKEESGKGRSAAFASRTSTFFQPFDSI